MSIQKFNEIRRDVGEEVQKMDGYVIFNKVVAIINKIGKDFEGINPGELLEYKVKLSGYKYYLSDFIGELQRLGGLYHLEIKNYRASKWSEISERIKAEKGKVSNKEEIENEIIKATYEMSSKEIIYNNLYYQYRIKMSSMDDIVMCITQRLAILKREIEVGL